MPMLRTIKIAAIAVSMVNPVRSLGGKSAAACTVKVIRREAEVAAALMIFGNSVRHEVPSGRIGVGFVGAVMARALRGSAHRSDQMRNAALAEYNRWTALG